MKLVFGGRDWPARKILLDGLRAEGKVTRHMGPVPAGWLEEEILVWLERFRKTSA